MATLLFVTHFFLVQRSHFLMDIARYMYTFYFRSEFFLLLEFILSGNSYMVPLAIRYIISAILSLSSANAIAAGRERWICDLKYQVYNTSDSLKSIIGFAYGSACGKNRQETWVEAKVNAGQDIIDADQAIVTDIVLSLVLHVGVVNNNISSVMFKLKGLIS